VKRYKCFASLLIAFAFLSVAHAWAADPPPAPEKMPAILAALDTGKVAVLDDKAAGAVRGQAYQYVLVRTFLNAFDFGAGIQWSPNPFAYRYGAWGGPGWTAGGGIGSDTPADAMDEFFKAHDLGGSDAQLLLDLQGLPATFHPFWGTIYVPPSITPGSNVPVSKNVWVSGTSVVGGRIFLGWRPMPFTEYARREAIIGMQLLGVLP
jgi:hypothetical protein